MKAQKFKLQIPEPCHEKWSEMSPREQGAFCKSCAKTVIDFSKMTDRELVDYLSKPKQGKTCGRFTKFQVNRVIQATQPQNPWYLRLKHFALGVLFSLGLPGLVKAKESISLQTTTTLSDDEERIFPSTIAGYVYDYLGTPLPDARIVLMYQGEKTAFTATSDENGRFQLNVSDELKWKDVLINFAAAYYYPEDIAIHSDKEIKVRLMPFEMPYMPDYMMGDVIIDEPVQHLEDSDNIREIKGKVIDEEGHSIFFAEVYIEGKEIGTTTDGDGRFVLKLPDDIDLSAELGLFVQAIGYKTYFTRLDETDLAENQHIVLQVQEDILIGFVIMDPIPNDQFEKPHSFDKNYTEPHWKQEGFGSKREYLEWKNTGE